MATSNAAPFLGQGITHPFLRGASDVANDNGLGNVQSCVSEVLGTRRGELPWRPEFGCDLYKLLHRKGPAILDLARHYVTDALSKWEPRVIVTSVDVSFDPLAQTMTVALLYNVITANVPGNQVIFADVSQTLQLAA